MGNRALYTALAAAALMSGVQSTRTGPPITGIGMPKKSSKHNLRREQKRKRAQKRKGN